MITQPESTLENQKTPPTPNQRLYRVVPLSKKDEPEAQRSLLDLAKETQVKDPELVPLPGVTLTRNPNDALVVRVPTTTSVAAANELARRLHASTDRFVIVISRNVELLNCQQLSAEEADAVFEDRMRDPSTLQAPESQFPLTGQTPTPKDAVDTSTTLPPAPAESIDADVEDDNSDQAKFDDEIRDLSDQVTLS